MAVKDKPDANAPAVEFPPPEDAAMSPRTHPRPIIPPKSGGLFGEWANFGNMTAIGVILVMVGFLVWNLVGSGATQYKDLMSFIRDEAKASRDDAKMQRDDVRRTQDLMDKVIEEMRVNRRETQENFTKQNDKFEKLADDSKKLHDENKNMLRVQDGILKKIEKKDG